jgi:ergothioneine biosynthesis protein EgtB
MTNIQTPTASTQAGGQCAQSPPRPASSLAEAFTAVRAASMHLRQPLSDEDCQVQSMPDASPAKWHLAHTTWFYEQFILQRFRPGYTPHHPDFSFLFNSYYNAVGPRNERPRRGLITRPSLKEVEIYRHAVDAAMLDLLEDSDLAQNLRPLLEIGLNHEQQHQELLLTDLKHLLSCNPLHPAYIPAADEPPPDPDAPHPEAPLPLRWHSFDEGLRWIGHEGEDFAYDNESPRHRTFLDAFELAARPVTCAEYIGFIEAGGYTDPRHWLDEGWTTAQREHWHGPMYWERRDDQWWHFTLSGMRPVVPTEPVCHVSYFEADAFARWAGARLPREAEWESACATLPIEGNFAETGLFHPTTVKSPRDPRAIQQAFGDVWEWTASPYTAYPGYTPPEGALGEYNGKFMCNQWVLRGGSCATPASHIRATYRNFFSAAARWQFSGFRLARDAR